MKVVTFFIHAGGAGKTSLALNVAHTLVEKGYRVLAIDLDPQANLTSWLGMDAQYETCQTLHDFIITGSTFPTPINVHGIDLIPADLHLSNTELAMSAIQGSVLSLKTHFDEMRVKGSCPWDIIIIDSPPSLGNLAYLGAISSDELLVPLPTTAKGLRALESVEEALALYRRFNSKIRVGRIIPTMYDARQIIHQEVMAILEKSCVTLLTTPLPYRSAAWNKAAAVGIPVRAHIPHHVVARDIERVTDELESFLGIQKNITEVL